MFNEIKSEVLNLIKVKTEVNRFTKINTTGIYMLYVDCFDDNNVLPIYIGKVSRHDKSARSFQSRYKEHLQQILILNRFKYWVYKNNFLENLFKDIIGKYHSFYDGRFKACKIFKYMVEHNCKLSDLKMIVLEEIEEENEINKKEIELIEKYLAPYFGFNQLTMVTEWHKNKKMPDNEYHELMYNDSLYIDKYFDYGFTKFNYLHTFPKRESDSYPEKLNNIINKLYNQNKKYISPKDSEYEKEQEKLYLLFPSIEYECYPLGDMYVQKEFDISPEENNVCYINIEFTTHGKYSEYDIYTNINKIDYVVKNNNKTYSKSTFINNDLDDFWKNTDNMYYIEKARECGPFNLWLRGHKKTYITAAMEYANGINEFTMKNKNKENYIDIFKELDEITNEETKIIYSTSGYKNTILREANNKYLKNNKFIVNLCNSIKK